MEYVLLRGTELKISRIGFGCMSLHPGMDNADQLLRTAIERGINYFDTADLYDNGGNEEMVGRALKPLRDRIVLATKVGNQPKPDGNGWSWNPGKQYILGAVEQSLRRLQVDHIDLYQLHGGTIDDPIDETIEAFEILKTQGKIRCYGISSIRPNVIREWIRRSDLSSVMMQYSVLDRRPEEDCFELLSANGVNVLVRGSIAQGLLAGKPPRDYLGRSAEEVGRIAGMLKSGSGHFTPAQLAIGYALKHPAVSSVVIGIRTFDQLDDAMGAVDIVGKEEDLYRKLTIGVSPNYYKEHR